MSVPFMRSKTVVFAVTSAVIVRIVKNGCDTNKKKRQNIE